MKMLKVDKASAAAHRGDRTYWGFPPFTLQVDNWTR
jgi:hypothetical protein